MNARILLEDHGLGSSQLGAWLVEHTTAQLVTLNELRARYATALDEAYPLPMLDEPAVALLTGYASLLRLTDRNEAADKRRALDEAAGANAHRQVGLYTDVLEQRARYITRVAWERDGLLLYDRYLFAPVGTEPPPPWVLTALRAGSLVDLRLGLEPASVVAAIVRAARGDTAATTHAQTPLWPTAPLFPQGVGTISSSTPMRALMDAMYHTNDWKEMEDGRPYYDHMPSIGRITTSLFPPDTSNATATTTMIDATGLSAPVVAMLNDKLRALGKKSDLALDVLMGLLVQSIDHPGDDGWTWITGPQLLDARGVQKIKKTESGVVRTAGHREERLREIAECVNYLEHIRLDMQSVTLHERGAGKRVRRTTHTLQSALIMVSERETRRVLIEDDPGMSPTQLALLAETSALTPIESAPVEVAWRYQIGTWLAPFLHAPNRQTAILFQQVLKYDPYHEQWEKRLAAYFTLHLRIDWTKNRPLRRRIGPLLRELNLPDNERYPERTKTRFEKAMKSLVAKGVLGSWDYVLDGDGQLPSRKWLERWKSWEITVTLPSRAIAHYADSMPPVRPARTPRTKGC